MSITIQRWSTVSIITVVVYAVYHYSGGLCCLSLQWWSMLPITTMVVYSVCHYSGLCCLITTVVVCAAITLLFITVSSLSIPGYHDNTSKRRYMVRAPLSQPLQCSGTTSLLLLRTDTQSLTSFKAQLKTHIFTQFQHICLLTFPSCHEHIECGVFRCAACVR